MSNGVSIGNFYVDRDGIERPIRFKSADLVNHPAPEGYVWAQGKTFRPHPSEGFEPLRSWSFDVEKEEVGYYDYYICVRQEEALARTQERKDEVAA